MNVINKIRTELKEKTEEKTKKSFQRFFKEEVKYYGVKTGEVGKLSKKYWEEVKDLKKEEIFSLCEELYSSGFCEEAFIVSWWVPKLTSQFTENDFKIFEKWVNKYIDNWAKCDGFCCNTIGNFIGKYPKYIQELKKWTSSNNRWVKRAASVSLIVPAKEGKYLKDVFEIADKLLLDKDDMVQKGYGWLLKEASRLHQKEIFDYVVKNKDQMPRTALRYAIELMPISLRQKAMER